MQIASIKWFYIVIKKAGTNIYSRKMDRTIHMISNHYSREKNAIQKLEEIILRDFNNAQDINSRL